MEIEEVTNYLLLQQSENIVTNTKIQTVEGTQCKCY